jgi:prevent-host-death family protein
MTLRPSDEVPISEAGARLTELATEVVEGGVEKIFTKNGVRYVAIVDAKKLDYYHALEAEHAGLLMLSEAEIGLRQYLAGQWVSPSELDSLLRDDGFGGRPLT